MHLQLAILHSQNTFNNGSFMMLINFIWHYMKILPHGAKVTFWIELDGADNVARVMQALAEEPELNKEIIIKQLPVKITSVDNSFFLLKIYRLIKKMYAHPSLFKRIGIDSIIILGGDDISEYYKKWQIISDLYRIYRYAKKIPVYLPGQTIGPFHGLRKKIAKACLSNTIIYTRDPLCTEYLTIDLKLKKENIHESADLCFPDMPVIANKEDLLEQYGLLPSEYITLIPGGHYTLYTKDKIAYLDAWIKLIRQLLNDPKLRTKKIVFLPHVTRPEDDREISLLLAEQVNAPERICRIKEELLPQQLRFILGNGYFTISSRMHAALSTFQMRKPAIALGHSVKYEGVIGKSLLLPELLISCPVSIASDPDRFTSEIMQKIDYIQRNYSKLCKHLEEHIPQLQGAALTQVKSIAESTLTKLKHEN